MTLNGVMAVTLRYFTEFGKPVLQKTICGGIYARVYCIFSACTMSSYRKFTFAISSPDEFLVSIAHGDNILSVRKFVNVPRLTHIIEERKQKFVDRLLLQSDSDNVVLSVFSSNMFL